MAESYPIQSGWRRGDPLELLLSREWLVTNGLGGYASGTIGGAVTRRFHGKLIAALPAPLGRFMMLNHLEERLSSADAWSWRLSGDEHGGGREISYPEPDFLADFSLEAGLPVWRFEKNGVTLEKRLLMPFQQNSTCLLYTLISGPEVVLHLRPSLKFRPHEGLLDEQVPGSWNVRVNGREIEIDDGRGVPPLRILLFGDEGELHGDGRKVEHVIYRLERSRGYEHEGPLWTPGVMTLPLRPGTTTGLVISVESWDVIRSVTAEEAWQTEIGRRRKLLSVAGPAARNNRSAQLILAADQFLIRPATRAGDDARIRAAGDDPRTVIAGYHWFTDWGRDTMISLEGLTLVTGRRREAGNILRTFASYIRNGLIPNHFPEGEQAGLYHTADATLWFFQALQRYVDYTNDRETLRELLPRMVEILDHHLQGTDFGIGVDPADGLLRQGAEGYQLTWMDAKVDGWVVTPRRGKAVEINALFYNALRITERWLAEERDPRSADMKALADRVQQSFNERFWFAGGGYLYDVVDGPSGNDSALRPNQIFAVSLIHPVLDRERWRAVVEVVRRELLTPVGLRSLARDHPDYKPAYDGDLRARDAAYHQGTVWGWLIGPFVDAWLRVYPEDLPSARSFLDGFPPHLGDACIGTISEIFDAEEPYHPRGCASQAWSVAEVLRCLRLVED